MRKYLIFLIALASIAFGVCSPASADSCSRAFGYQGIGTGCNSVIASGGGSPVYSNATSGINNGCPGAPVTTCTVSGVIVPAGFIVVAAGAADGAAGSSGISGIAVCGTSLTAALTPSSPSGEVMIGLYYGTTAGGTCNVDVTSSAASAIFNIGIALAEISNLTSSAPGSTCDAIVSNSPGTVPCTSSITVSSGGFAVEMFAALGTHTFTAGSSSIAIDTQTNGGNISIGIGHSATAGSITPDVTSDSFINISVIAGAWR
jgi:hypothetical protein